VTRAKRACRGWKDKCAPRFAPLRLAAPAATRAAAPVRRAAPRNGPNSASWARERRGPPKKGLLGPFPTFGRGSRGSGAALCSSRASLPRAASSPAEGRRILRLLGTRRSGIVRLSDRSNSPFYYNILPLRFGALENRKKNGKSRTGKRSISDCQRAVRVRRGPRKTFERLEKTQRKQELNKSDPSSVLNRQREGCIGPSNIVEGLYRRRLDRRSPRLGCGARGTVEGSVEDPQRAALDRRGAASDEGRSRDGSGFALQPARRVCAFWQPILPAGLAVARSRLLEDGFGISIKPRPFGFGTNRSPGGPLQGLFGGQGLCTVTCQGLFEGP